MPRVSLKGRWRKPKSQENNHAHANVDEDDDDEDGEIYSSGTRSPRRGWSTRTTYCLIIRAL